MLLEVKIPDFFFFNLVQIPLYKFVFKGENFISFYCNSSQICHEKKLPKWIVTLFLKKKKNLKFTGECYLLNSCKFIFYLLEKASLVQFLAEQQRQEGVFAEVGGIDLGQIPLHSAQVSCRIALKKNTSRCFPISQDRS